MKMKTGEIVKPESSYTRFDEEWKVMENNILKVQELKIGKQGNSARHIPPGSLSIPPALK